MYKVDFPFKNQIFFHTYVSLPEGTINTNEPNDASRHPILTFKILDFTDLPPQIRQIRLRSSLGATNEITAVGNSSKSARVSTNLDPIVPRTGGQGHEALVQGWMKHCLKSKNSNNDSIPIIIYDFWQQK